jgi:putative methyltransferase (TIGR04325 family)
LIRDSLLEFRLWQIRRSASLFSLLNRVEATARILQAVRSVPLAPLILRKLMGYRFAFGSLSEARAIAARYSKVGDHSLAHARDHLSVPVVVSPSDHKAWRHWTLEAASLSHSAVARSSDYAALFHLGRLAPSLSSVFDLGGNIGNLFYGFAKYLDFRPDLRWTVYELPEVLEIGQTLALERGENRLRFTRDLSEASGSDVFIASGSLHYFEQSLPEMIGSLQDSPKHVIVNRTPVTSSKPVATVQDGGDSLIGCQLIQREELMNHMCRLGYLLADSWTVPELSIEIPFYPEYSVRSYSGLYFRLDRGQRPSLSGSHDRESRAI